MTKNQVQKIQKVTALISFLTKMGLENGLYKEMKVKVSKKVVRFLSPLAFGSMSVWTMWQARNMLLT